MLKRIYIDNFRSLTNFELSFDSINVFLGPNGSGKSSVFDALRKVQSLVVDGDKVDQVFLSRDLSSGRGSNKQSFELEIELEGNTYVYSVSIEHDLDRGKMRIAQESLSFGKKTLFEFIDGTARLYRDDFSKGPEYPFDWSQSGIGVLQRRLDNRKLTRFKDELARWIIVRPNPPSFQSETKSEDERLATNLDNFAAWYRHASQENLGAVSRLFEVLREIFPAFDSLNLAESGENARTLKAHFRSEAASRATVRYTFDQLSDGQRALVALYSLLHLCGEARPSLFIDEPDNYLALREIQPWLNQLVDACGESIEQALIISHHPVTIDYLAGAKARWFSREGESPSRVSNGPKNPVDGLSVSESMIRGWEA